MATILSPTGIKLNCTAKKKNREGGVVLEQSFFLLNAHSASSWHKKTIAFQLSPISSSLLYSISVKGRTWKEVCEKERGRGREGLGEGDLGGIKSGCWYTGGQTKLGVTARRIPLLERER